MITLRSETPERTMQLGEALGKAMAGGEIIALYAPLGAGKTVFTKGIAAGLGVAETVTSPTYTIISEYTARINLVHVDLYRIESEEEYDQLAVRDLFGYDTVIVIEWPERAGESLPGPVVDIRITIETDGSRTIELPENLASVVSEED